MRIEPTQSSLISIRGEIIGRDASNNLLLRNEAGIFRVKVSAEEIPDKGSQIHVVGTLHSFFYKRCRRHHLYIQANSLSPAAAEVDLMSLFLPLALGQ
jgi:hypothetical protein